VIVQSDLATAREAMVEAYYVRTRRRRRHRVVRRLVVLGAILALWEIAGQVSSPLFFAPFSESLVAVFDASFISPWLTSLQALLIGYGLASVVGIAVGLVMGRFRAAEWLLNPWLTILLAAPMVAVIPLFVVIFGLSLAARVAIVFSFVFVYVAINTFAGTKSIQRDLFEMSASFGLKEWQLFRWVVLPGAAPLIMTGLRLGFGRAIIGMLLGEMLLLAVGIGGRLLEASNYFDTAGVLAIVLMLLVFSWAGGSLIEAIDHRINRWQHRTT
jgi:NitT/TauT family transport system permease protein